MGAFVHARKEGIIISDKLIEPFAICVCHVQRGACDLISCLISLKTIIRNYILGTTEYGMKM